MQRIGRVLHISSSKNIILKAENLPRIGDEVVDEHLKPVGMIFDIFGPTLSPYVAVRPHTGYMQHLINHVLYTIPSKPKVEKRRKER